MTMETIEIHEISKEFIRTFPAKSGNGNVVCVGDATPCWVPAQAQIQRVFLVRTNGAWHTYVPGGSNSKLFQEVDEMRIIIEISKVLKS